MSTAALLEKFHHAAANPAELMEIMDTNKEAK